MQGGALGGVGRGGSMSTVSREDNMVMSSEDSSSPDEGELELGLGLGLGGGGGGGGGGCFKDGLLAVKDQYARILTAKDLPSVVSASSSSTSSSSSTLSRADGIAGTKRIADSVSASNGAASNQVVGWPPIRAYRINSMVNQAKTVANEEFNSMIEKKKDKSNVVEKKNNGGDVNKGNVKVRTSLFVKVNIDGSPIGRKVDLSAHGGYESLAQTLEDMFLRPISAIGGIRSCTPEHNTMAAARASKLLDGSSGFVLTYEDKEGDWMLVGDVPWGMFIGSVKRLGIMRTSEATGIQEKNGRQSRPI